MKTTEPIPAIEVQMMMLPTSKVLFLYEKVLNVNKRGKTISKEGFIDETLNKIITHEHNPQNKLEMMKILLDYLEMTPE